jgi:Asp-tRNA(Asn)/Glu-tRNA(Gln) amidotransferase A subunit family amidase
MNRIDLTQCSATDLAGLIAGGEVSALEAVESHIERIERVNGKLNAVVVKRYDAAREEARAADRLRAEARSSNRPLPALLGVPVTLKECLDLTGTPSTFGLPSRATHRAQADEVHVARLRRAGAVVLGKTNVAQMLIFVEADNPVYGRSANPWNLQRSCGGSSGGEGAIIAAGGSPLGLGTDVGGSSRVPAAFCGIVGFKPTQGRCPDPGRFSIPFGQQAISSEVGLLARQVDDVALALRVINGSGDPAVDGTFPLHDPATVDIAKLRVGFYTQDATFATPPSVKRAVRDAAQILRDAGVQTVEWTPPDVRRAEELIFGLFTSGARLFKEIIQGDKRDPRVALLLTLGNFSHRTTGVLGGLISAIGQKTLGRGMSLFGRRSSEAYWRLVEALEDYRAQFAETFANAPGGALDAVLSPACGLPAVAHGATKDLGLMGGYTLLHNVLGWPAGVVPVTRVRADEESDRPASSDLVEKAARRSELGSAGLPLGVQIAAPRWREHVALALMRAIQQSAQQRPDYPSRPAL